MPYKDKAKAKEYARQAMAKRRGVIPDVIPTSAESVIPNHVIPADVIPSDGWHDVEAYITREGPAMPNLERLQRIAGSLGKYAGEVWFGLSGLTMQDIGEVIGTLPPAYGI